jgi:hypothetical protein
VKIFKTMIGFDDAPQLYQVDTIEYDGKMWLVPHWLDTLDKQWRMPVRIICLDSLAHQKLPPGSPYGDFSLSAPISRAVFDGQRQPQLGDGYVVIETPPIRLKSQRHLQ